MSCRLGGCSRSRDSQGGHALRCHDSIGRPRGSRGRGACARPGRPGGCDRARIARRRPPRAGPASRIEPGRSGPLAQDRGRWALLLSRHSWGRGLCPGNRASPVPPRIATGGPGPRTDRAPRVRSRTRRALPRAGSRPSGRAPAGCHGAPAGPRRAPRCRPVEKGSGGRDGCSRRVPYTGSFHRLQQAPQGLGAESRDPRHYPTRGACAYSRSRGPRRPATTPRLRSVRLGAGSGSGRLHPGGVGTWRADAGGFRHWCWRGCPSQETARP